MIAAALVLEPEGLVCDEPVSALDVSIRAQVIHLLMDLKRERNLGLIFITHDVGLAWALCDRVAVMYLGRIIEQGTTEQVLSDPRHPYTQALLSVVPSPVPRADGDRRTILEGELPDASRIPSGCRFHPRCPVAFDRCKTDDPEELIQVGGGHVGGVLEGRRLTQQRGQTPHGSRWHFCHTRATNARASGRRRPLPATPPSRRSNGQPLRGPDARGLPGRRLTEKIGCDPVCSTLLGAPSTRPALRRPSAPRSRAASRR